MPTGRFGLATLLAVTAATLPSTSGDWVTRTEYSDAACSTDVDTHYFKLDFCYPEDSKGTKYTLSSTTVTAGLYDSTTCGGSATSSTPYTLDTCTAETNDNFKSVKVTTATITKYWRYRMYTTKADCTGDYEEGWQAINQVDDAEFVTDTNTLTVDTDSTRTTLTIDTCLADDGRSYLLKEVVWEGTTYPKTGSVNFSPRSTVALAPVVVLATAGAAVMGAAMGL
mmetsp:Transcript_66080/g.138021  ORF Transcript_66080/g.138021 Transcript_66080/m.138021 type:complete len:225 (+) Transcript_66080:75-749(+)|eukprot:CAMPEP_0206572324 /NCGR_PEP_ID=MMETSP0325_2-20121206/28173_1 /ASSEMBLY_ACC=CAM_ASM_000347 /TAXON_ID=2866 /ORGANISM="Crypthecodinium cohnii, Strain Seligo" /LENGTH=224 /DNA_ID=CAMNT_0054076497 /DNA_START=45 /DNA_END=719 /DNA_ORIENTATION=-